MISCPFKAPTIAQTQLGAHAIFRRRFEQREGLSFTSCHIEGPESSGTIAWPFDSFSQIVFVLNGSISVSIPDTGTSVVHAGELFMLSLKDWQANCSLEGKVELGVIECSSEIWESITTETEAAAHTRKACFGCSRRSEAIFFQAPIESKVFETAKRTARLTGSSPTDRLKVEAGTLELLVFALEARVLSESPAAEPCLREEEESALLAAANYLEQNLCADHSLAAVSQKARINEFKLKKGFRERFNTTVFGYLRQKRMEEAKDLFSRKTWTVLEVANAVGYSNPSHFTRAFRQTYGLNPKQFLSKMRR